MLTSWQYLGCQYEFFTSTVNKIEENMKQENGMNIGKYEINVS